MDSELAHELLSQMGQRVPGKLVLFGAALDEADCLSDGWPYFLEKPYKWADEYAAWTALDSPQQGDPTWDEFMQALEVLA